MGNLFTELAELETIHQGELLDGKLPPGPSAPNAERAAGLRLLEARRREGVAPAKLYDERGESWGCMVVGIPELDFAVHVRRNPDLQSKDRHTRNRAWQKFLREFGSQYGVDASIGKRKRNTGIIIR